MGWQIHICEACGSEFQSRKPNKANKYCSHSCYWIKKKGSTGYWAGKTRPALSEEWKRKISEALQNKDVSKETGDKIRQSKLGKRRPEMSGSNHPAWIEDRTKVVDRKGRKALDTEYRHWRRNVYRRDAYKCRIANVDCDGQLEAHHILRWSEHPNLRHDVSNGITLCRKHHPRKRVDEQELAPIFQELVRR